MKTYELESVDILVCRYKFFDVTVGHPLRNHGKLILGHHHSQQRQYVRMPEGFPGYDLFAEPLQAV